MWVKATSKIKGGGERMYKLVIIRELFLYSSVQNFQWQKNTFLCFQARGSSLVKHSWTLLPNHYWVWNLQRCSSLQCRFIHCLSSSWFFFCRTNLLCKGTLEMCWSQGGCSDKCCPLGCVTVVHVHFGSTCCLHLHLNACWQWTKCGLVVTELAFKQRLFMCAKMSKKHP